MGIITRPGRVLGILTGLNILNYLDRYIVAGLLPPMTADLKLSGAQAGLLQSAFIWVYTAASPAAGWLGDSRSRVRLCAIGVALWSAATFGAGLAPTFAWLLFARALVGVGEAGYAVVTPSLLSDLYPPERRGRVLSIFYAALPVGTALGIILGGQIAQAFGWRAAFLVAGGPGLLLALALLMVAEPPRGGRDGATMPVPLSPKASLRALAGRPSYLYNTAAQTIYTFSMGGLATWMPTYFVRERGLGLAQATLLFGTLLLTAGFVGTIVGGQLGDRLARRHPGAHFSFSGWALVASTPFTALAVLSSSPAIFWPAMFCTLLLLFMNTGPLNAAMVNVLPPDLRNRGFALYVVAIHLLGDGISPTAIGWASDAIGLRIPVLVSGLMLAAAGVVLLAGRGALKRDLAAVAQ